MITDPLRSTLLELDAQLGGNARLCIGGGYGLYLKQLHLMEHSEIRTLFPLANCPAARTTEDIDLFLRAEVVADSGQMEAIRNALDVLGFATIKSAEFMQFFKRISNGIVKIDVLVGPMGAYAGKVRFDSRRVKPIRSVNMHARRCDEAIGIEESQVEIPVQGMLTTGEAYATTVLVPQAFTYLLMKLLTFRDQLINNDKNLGRHHALDIYRIVALLTETEDDVVHHLRHKHREDPNMQEARRVVSQYFANETSLGILRIREHPLGRTGLDLDRFAKELADIFPALK